MRDERKVGELPTPETHRLDVTVTHWRLETMEILETPSRIYRLRRGAGKEKERADGEWALRDAIREMRKERHEPVSVEPSRKVSPFADTGRYFRETEKPI